MDTVSPAARSTLSRISLAHWCSTAVGQTTSVPAAGRLGPTSSSLTSRKSMSSLLPLSVSHISITSWPSSAAAATAAAPSLGSSAPTPEVPFCPEPPATLGGDGPEPAPVPAPAAALRFGGRVTMREMVDTVLPSPWSSARMPPTGRHPSSRAHIQPSASRWCGMMSTLSSPCGASRGLASARDSASTTARSARLVSAGGPAGRASGTELALATDGGSAPAARACCAASICAA
mmetsp:Transcript_34573/g.88482  ORF Transcript_34573/g.88482 Transcript_34573/m.88482 type:complete len:233 (+) Transcript_34573:482-1180(+)